MSKHQKTLHNIRKTNKKTPSYFSLVNIEIVDFEFLKRSLRTWTWKKFDDNS